MKKSSKFIILLWIVRSATVALTILLFYFVFSQYFFPSGKLEVVYDFEEDSRYISHLNPWQRLMPPEENDGIWSQKIKDDLVYFDVFNPRWFQYITAEITYRNENQPIFEIAGRVNSGNGYLSKPLQSKIIDNLDWEVITDGEVSLMQKYKEFDTVSEFTENVPKDKNVAQYFYKVPQDKIIPNYKSSSKKTVIDHAIRGSHTMFTYIKNEDLDFEFIKEDLNRYAGEDIVNIEIYHNKDGEMIFTEEIPDDGDKEVSTKSSEAQIASILIPNLEEGVYRIEIKGGNDFLIRKINSTQKLIVFLNRVFLADNEEYFPNFVRNSKPSKLFTNGSIISFNTPHLSGLQDVIVNSETVSIDTVKKTYDSLVSGLSEISIKSNDLAVESNGIIAFSKDQYFYPYLENVDDISIASNPSDLDYIIFQYSSPKNEDGWLVQTQTFDVNNLYKNSDSNHRFRLSAPSLNDNEDTIEISEIKIIFEKPPITIGNLPQRLKNWLSKAIDKI